MWNSLLKLSLVSLVWKRYKKTLILLPVLLLYFWIVGLGHNDYLAYAELRNERQWVGVSFLFKWLLLLLGVVFFVLAHLRRGVIDDVVDDDIEKLSRTEKIAASFFSETKHDPHHDDGFESIRAKKTLKSKADVILSNKK